MTTFIIFILLAIMTSIGIYMLIKKKSKNEGLFITLFFGITFLIIIISGIGHFYCEYDAIISNRNELTTRLRKCNNKYEKIDIYLKIYDFNKDLEKSKQNNKEPIKKWFTDERIEDIKPIE